MWKQIDPNEPDIYNTSQYKRVQLGTCTFRQHPVIAYAPKSFEPELLMADVARWRADRYLNTTPFVQNAFPHCDDNIREFIMNQTMCGHCFDDVFAHDDDDDDD